jgi:hypothetical protein
MADALASTILALAIAHAQPGHSPYSLEPVPECGTDARHPSCPLEPVCELPVFYCKAPRWSAPRNAWVRVESPDVAKCRYARIAQAIAATARKLHECRDEQGSTLPTCAPIGWPGSTKALALSMLTVALHESGLREDVQSGLPPLGRGPGGGACLVQVRPSQAPIHASWLSSRQRESIQADRQQRARFVQTLLGEDPGALRRCFEIGARMLVRARLSCGASTVPWDHGMFSMYGTGTTCRNREIGRSRKRTLGQLVAASKRATEPVDAGCK